MKFIILQTYLTLNNGAFRLKFNLIFSAQRYALVQHRWRLKPQVSPVISTSSPKMKSHGHFLDSPDGSNSVIGIPQTVILASVRGRSCVIGKIN